VNVSSITMRVLVTTGTRYYYRPASVVGEYRRGEVAEVLERVVVVSVQVPYTHTARRLHTVSTQPCIPPGSLNRVPASAGVRAGMSALPGGR